MANLSQEIILKMTVKLRKSLSEYFNELEYVGFDAVMGKL